MPRKSSFDPSKHNAFRLARINQGATLARVAKGMNITPAHLNDIEHGRRSMTPAANERWARALAPRKAKR